MNIIRQLFTRRTVREVAEEQRYHAQIKALEARQAAEHYKAIADMYEAQAQRLHVTLLTMGGKQ